MNAETICILGGTGFVGSHLAHRLTRYGHHVRILSRRPARHRALLANPAISVVGADVYRQDELERCFAGCSTVINLVGILNQNDSNGFRRAHVELPQTVCNAMHAAGVHRLLHMSALNADEREQQGEYLKTRGQGEALVHACDDLLVTSYRPSVIFGPGDSFFNRFAGLLKLSPLMLPLACPDSRFAPVFVGDVVEAMCRTLDNASAGERFDLCGPQVFTLHQLVDYTREQIGMDTLIVDLGDFASRVQARILGLVPGKPFTMDNYYSLQRNSVCACNGLVGLGINPTSVDAIVPGYLARRTARGRYDAMRKVSRRDNNG